MYVESDVTGTRLRSVQTCSFKTFLWGERAQRVSDFRSGKKVSFELEEVQEEREAMPHVHSQCAAGGEHITE